MDLIELETRAKNGEDYPKGLNFEERELFANFRVLYFLLRNGQVSKENARMEKALYLQEYKIRTNIINQYNEDLQRKTAIHDILNKYGGVRNVPPDVLEQLFKMLDNCLYINKDNNKLMEQVNKYLGLEWTEVDANGL